MRIRGWRIDGYGVLSGSSLDRLGDGVSVFFGRNEAGKTTLLSFLRGVLFGYPHRNAKANHYEPLASGVRHGGRLLIEGDEGVYVVDRAVGRNASVAVTRPDGSSGDLQDLIRLTGGIDRTLFESVFAFSLRELEDVASLSGREIQDRIFSAGITGAGMSVVEALKKLDADRQALFGRKGSLINELSAAIKQLRTESLQAELTAASLPDAQGKEKVAFEEIAKIKRALAETQRRLSATELTIRAWPDYSRRQASLKELEELSQAQGGSCIGISESDEALVARLQAQRQAVSEECGRLRDEISAAEAKLAGLQVDERLQAIAAEVDALIELKPLHLDRMAKADELRARKSASLAAVKRCLEELGLGWSAERLRAVDTSLPSLERLRSAVRRIESVDRRATSVADDLRRLKDSTDGFEKDLEDIERRIGEARHGVDPASLQAKQEALRNARRLLSTIAGRRTAYEALHQECLDRRQDVERLAERRRRIQIPGILRALGLAAAAAPLACLSIWLWANRPGAAALGLTMAALALGVLAITQAISRQRHLQESRLARELAQREEGHLTACTQRLIEAESEIESGLQSLRGQLLTLGLLVDDRLISRTDFAASKGPSDELSGALGEQLRAISEALDAAEAVVSTEVERLGELRRLETEAGRIATQRDGALSEAKRLSDELEQITAESRRAQSEFERLIRSIGLPEELSPADALDLVERIRDCKRLLEQADRESSDLEAAEKAITEWEERARQVLANDSGGLQQRGGIDLVTAVMAISDEASRNRLVSRDRQVASAALSELRAKLAGAESSLSDLDDRLKATIERLGATDMDDFVRQCELRRRREELVKQIRLLDRSIESVVGSVDASADVYAELACGDVMGWKARIDELQKELERLGSAHEDAVRRHRDIELRVESIKQSSDLAEIAFRESTLLARLKDAAFDWTVKTLARGFLTSALSEFERTRQPRVLMRASDYFRRMVGGRYLRIIQPVMDDPTGAGREPLEVEDSGLARLPVSKLSTGTQQQLYLAIRLGLADDLFDHGVDIPLVMDDVLVNFDPMRSQITAEVLCRFAENRQVLFFTCHPETVRQILAVCSDVAIYEMRDGRVERSGWPLLLEDEPTIAASSAASSADSFDASSEAATSGAVLD